MESPGGYIRRTIKRLYVNGAEVASRFANGQLVYPGQNSAVPVTIGSGWESNASSARIAARIDEVAIYNRALTATEIF